MPHHVSALLERPAQAPRAWLIHSISADTRADGSLLGYHGGAFQSWRQLDTGFMRICCALFSRSLLQDGVRFDERFEVLEDMEFFIQCAQRTEFAFVAKPTATCFVEAGNSGAGAGANRNPPRIAQAVGQLRAKRCALDDRLRRSWQFRVEHALWTWSAGDADAARFCSLPSLPSSRIARTRSPCRRCWRVRPTRDPRRPKRFAAVRVHRNSSRCAARLPHGSLRDDGRRRPRPAHRARDATETTRGPGVAACAIHA